MAREVFDVSGAGDTLVAVFACAIAVGASRIDAARIANHAAGVVVGKAGTATLTRRGWQIHYWGQKQLPKVSSVCWLVGRKLCDFARPGANSALL